jgi:hypothetical protein
MLKLASHLTERDRHIAKDCFEYRVLTTSQITRLYFTGPRTASARLDVLYRLRVLDRFAPQYRWERELLRITGFSMRQAH